MSKANCKCKAPECEECPEWIFTFADLVMLMMGFFVILWVLKPNPGKQGGTPEASDDLVKMEGAIRGAFGYIPDPSSKDPVDVEMLMKKIQRIKLNGPGEKGRVDVPRTGAEGTEDEVTMIRRSKQATVGGRILFPPGDPELRPEMLKMLDEIAELIRGHRNIVLVKGHAGLDDYPDSATSRQKMDLSLKRAQHVADYLVAKGVSPDILRVEGCSTFEPVLQRAYTAEGRANNRRVEVEATATLVESLQDAPSTRPSVLDPTPAVTPMATIEK